MKTHREFLAEAHRLEGLGGEYARDGRFDAARFLLSLPESPSRELALGAEERATIRRWIDVAMVEGALEYRLWESATAAGSPLNGSHQDETFVMGSDSAFDVLVEGHERCERDRLRHALGPFAERVDEEEFSESIDPTVVEEIEKIVEADELSPSARLHAKADIVEFLEGRIGPSEFINVAIERHYHRELETESIEQRPRERIALDEF